RSIGVCNPVEVPFNTENEISELIVVSELACSNECSVVVYAVAQAQAEETVGHVTSAPGSTDVGAEVESSPTEGRSHIDWRRRIDRRTRANFSGIRSHRKCQQRRYGGGRMEQLAHGSSPHFEWNALNSKDRFSANPLSRPMKESLSLLRNYNKARCPLL